MCRPWIAVLLSWQEMRGRRRTTSAWRWWRAAVTTTVSTEETRVDTDRQNEQTGRQKCGSLRNKCREKPKRCSLHSCRITPCACTSESAWSATQRKQKHTQTSETLLLFHQCYETSYGLCSTLCACLNLAILSHQLWFGKVFIKLNNLQWPKKISIWWHWKRLTNLHLTTRQATRVKIYFKELRSHRLAVGKPDSFQHVDVMKLSATYATS